MKRLDIYRLFEHGQRWGTFSRWLIDGKPYCFGVELPWNDNQRGTSCIPPGEYFAEIYDSPTHGPVYQLIDVPGRSNCQIHAANFGTLKPDGEGYQLRGCLAPGEKIARIVDPHDRIEKLGVTSSRTTLERLMGVLGGERIQVVIHGMDESVSAQATLARLGAGKP